MLCSTRIGARSVRSCALLLRPSRYFAHGSCSGGRVKQLYSLESSTGRGNLPGFHRRALITASAMPPAKARKPRVRKVMESQPLSPDMLTGAEPIGTGQGARQVVVKAEVVSGAIVASAGVQVIEKQERQADSSEHPANETLMIDKETPIKRSFSLEVGTDAPVKAKKKRSYANAYTRKGQGLSAAIESMKAQSAVKEEIPEVGEKPPPRKRARQKRVKEESALEGESLQPIEAIPAIAAEPEGVAPEKKPRKRVKKVAVQEAVLAEVTSEEKPKRRGRKPKAPKAVADAEASVWVPGSEETPKKTPKRTPRKTPQKPKVKTEDGGLQAEGAEAVVEGEGSEAKPEKKKRASRKVVDPNAFKIPTEELLEEAAKMSIAERPVPNLGFACLNATLRAQKPPIYTNRDCIKKTWEEFGVEKISQLALDNCTAIAALIHWNHEHGIRFFRMSSKIFPWCTEWELDQLPQKEEIVKQLAFAGNLARAFDQRLTFHPSHFVKLGCEDGPLLDRSIKELEVHSLIFDLMGFEPSHYNKINIHIGGQYGDKAATISRFAKNFRRLNASTQKRLTVENDDISTSYSITDLMVLHEQTGIPLVFDFHHHRFCPGDLSEEEAFKTAIGTWPKGIRPVVHWSESQAGRKPHAHSDFVQGPLRLYGLESEVDVMIESKAKELALQRLRDPTFKPSAAALAAAITTD